MKKNILITGGTGFLGSHLCHKLYQNKENNIICVDCNFTGDIINVKDLLNKERFTFINHDIINPIDFDFKIDEIYNLACPASPDHYQFKNAIFTTKTNVIGVLNLCELAKKHGSKILQTSTSEVYGDPKEHPQKETYFGNVNPCGIRSCYDEGKRCAESILFDYHRNDGLEIKVARIFNTYGPKMNIKDGRMISNFVVKSLQNDDIEIYGDGKATRSVCYVDDMIDGFIKLMSSDKTITGPVNLGNTNERNILYFATMIVEKTSSKSKIIFKEKRGDDPVQRKPDITLAKNLLNWKPLVSFEDGIFRTIEYFKEILKIA
ncbi:UDP-glucuronic acid decarboxylase family protein [Candidatus Deianiraea vastatrix]|uniref:UDP-glucuronate decarboxylase n=1 Tax=Candidatus Deianiraea vastatrix TaxID=2163644 RepID=A0A5B8XG65_9RICK|nr:UDP-glucuronic acid decarboxylase family protein [Candidatus Deianiraea vastatrix]QED23314.1 dTDP-glucose 4,6-dehydratase [Candidatus Deianiraea vastatrix]